MNDESVLYRADRESATVEQEVATDLIKRGFVLVPVVAGLCGLIWGWAGVVSAVAACALVFANFWASAVLLGWAARISYGLLMGVALFGFVIRMALVGAAAWGLLQLDIIEPLPLGIVLIAAHVGLLAWELRYVSASLAFPGLKPPTDLEKLNRSDLSDDSESFKE